MRNYKVVLLLFLISVFSLSFVAGCSDVSTSSKSVDEYATLLDYVEQTDFINTYAPAIKAASAVQTDLTSGTQYIIDIRSADAYNQGHISGAVNVSWADIISHVEGLASNPESIVIVCYTGQSAAYAACLLRMLGHDNVYSMAFGMSSWSADFDSWTTNLSNQYATDFETTMHAKGSAVDPPVIETGEKDAADILRKRVEAVLAAGFSDGAVSASTVVPNADDYYIINYWPESDYTAYGHIEGAFQYTPKQDLKSTTNLNKIPADETVVVYCYTGQTSAYITAFLKVLGYNAKSLKFGANNMIYDVMDAHKFSDASVMNYSYVTTP